MGDNLANWSVFGRWPTVIITPEGLANVVVYLDDILITGINHKEHIRVLVEGLKRM